MPSEFYKWLARKRYQYEVTTSLYMLTPTEKFIFNSVLFLLLSLTTIAAFLYLPDHIVTIARRAFYYYAGDENSTVTSVKSIAEPAVETLRTSGQHARQVLGME
ncbi:hypothetical protein EJ08DRAFT_585788 [Tothia fuscella]|uniref:Uncharacterized protein n=1 Tax=Tothia fuscella TaxID=1048955 RepID=A0A9P4NV64_9PEZI|nr:hypothetical protein EJ08DRAFT_585788 [Tothia fuscella]